MTHREFNQFLDSINLLSPEQMRQLRSELESKLATERPSSVPTPGCFGATWDAAELRKSIPAEEWDKLPADGAQQLDHYLYGSPKRPTS